MSARGYLINKWCPDSESNQGHGDFQSPALPTELSGQMCFHNWWAIRDLNPGPAGYEPDALTNWANGPLKKMVGVAGFEPAAHWSQTSCATKLRYTPKCYFSLNTSLAGAVGFEPTARGFGDHCSTNWAIPLHGCGQVCLTHPHKMAEKMGFEPMRPLRTLTI